MRISDWSSDVCSSDLGGVVIQAIEQAIHPGRNGSTAHSREFPGLRNVRYRQYARYDFRINPRRRRLVPETKEGVGGKEELRDRPACAGVEFPLKILQIGLTDQRFQMGVGISGDTDIEGRDAHKTHEH